MTLDEEINAQLLRETLLRIASVYGDKRAGFVVAGMEAIAKKLIDPFERFVWSKSSAHEIRDGVHLFSNEPFRPRVTLWP